MPPTPTETECVTMWTHAWVSWTLCGVCNGPGAVYECGCAPISEGDCDCDGNQLDAVGECGVTRADTDGDGVCDVDEVVGCLAPLACNFNALATDSDPDCACTHSPHARPVLAPPTAAGWCWPTTTIWTACATPMKWKGVKTQPRNYRPGHRSGSM